MRLRRCMAGMTMIEVILLIAIGSFVVSGIVLFTRQMALNATQTRDRLAAMDVARVQMETVMRTAYNLLANADLTVNDFKVRQTVNPVSFGSIELREDNTLLAGNLTQPETLTLDLELSEVDILVDTPAGDFTSPILQLRTFRQSHVLQD